MLKEAWVSVTILVIAAFGGGIGVATWGYNRQIETLRQEVENYKGLLEEKKPPVISPPAKTSLAPPLTPEPEQSQKVGVTRSPSPSNLIRPSGGEGGHGTPLPQAIPSGPSNISSGPGSAFTFGPNSPAIGTLNVGPPVLRFTDDLKREILGRLPKDKPIEVASLFGDENGFLVANQIADFLKANGYAVTANSVTRNAWSKPVSGFSVQDNGDHRTFLVGSPPT